MPPQSIEFQIYRHTLLRVTDSKGDFLAVLPASITEIIVVNMAKLDPIFRKEGGGRILVKHPDN
jgi:hypothetical protein